MRKEIKRKLFHFLSLLYAAGFYFLGREGILKILIPLWLAEGALELARLFSPALNAKLMGFFGGIQREHEAHKVSGIFWTLLGAILTIGLFKDPKVVLCALGY